MRAPGAGRVPGARAGRGALGERLGRTSAGRELRLSRVAWRPGGRQAHSEHLGRDSLGGACCPPPTVFLGARSHRDARSALPRACCVVGRTPGARRRLPPLSPRCFFSELGLNTRRRLTEILRRSPGMSHFSASIYARYDGVSGKKLEVCKA